MKFSLRQILASSGGAVIAAVVASVFGVKGTIVGVAIGSVAATMGTAVVAQSIERGHEAVRQVVVRVPETAPLLRRLGGTGTNAPATASVDGSSAPTEVISPSSQGEASSGAETVRTTSMPPAPAAGTERLEISAEADAPATQRLDTTTHPMPPASPVIARRATKPGFSWKAIAGAIAIVFVLALLFITAIELISGKPLSAIFGGADTGTSLKNIVNPTPAPPTTPTTSSSTTSTTSGSTSTTSTSGTASTTTTTSAPTGTEPTTTPTTAPSSTTTTGGLGATTTTLAPSSP